jgi:hypothetical protein
MGSGRGRVLECRGVGDVGRRLRAQSFVNVHHRAQAWTGRGFADAVIARHALNLRSVNYSRLFDMTSLGQSDGVSLVHNESHGVTKHHYRLVHVHEQSVQKKGIRRQRAISRMKQLLGLGINVVWLNYLSHEF